MSATRPTSHETATVRSGDVELFCRRFGDPARARILILHGAGYYDSADWIEVATALAAAGNEVVAFDARGYGKSTWSPSADYSLEAQLADIAAVTSALGWEQTVLLGHSRGGSFALRYADRHPDRVAALILADSCPGRNARGAAPAAQQPIFKTLADALASTSRDPNSLASGAKRARLEEIFSAVDGGYALSARDPAFQSAGPDPWLALENLRVRTLAIRATRSRSFDDASAERVSRHAELVEVDSGHDLANEAPGELIAAVQRFLADG